MSGDGAVLALDPGSKRIGVAISDPERRMALPLEVLQNAQGWVDRVAEIVLERDVSEVVVGHPRTLAGVSGAAAEQAEAMTDLLRQRLSVRVTLLDERLTTVQAERALADAGLSSKKRRGKVDMSAATYLLESYLQGAR